MADPKIGMKFETYKSKTDSLSTNERTTQEFQTGEYSGTYNSARPLFGEGHNSTQITRDGNNPNPNYRRVSAFENFGTENQLQYEGATNNYQEGSLFQDVKYTRIIGDNYYAVDLNKNGTVDEGEIFENSSNCAVPKPDEQ